MTQRPLVKPMKLTPERIERFWNYVSFTPEEYFTCRFGHIMLRHFRPWLKNQNQILDYGCGAGFLIGHLLNFFNKGVTKVYGADISDNALTRVNNEYAHDNNFMGAFPPERLMRDQKTFDTLLLVETIEHLDDKALASVSEHIQQLLEPNAFLIVTTPNNENLEASQVYCPSCNRTFHRWQHVRSWTSESLILFLQDQGFSPEVVIETDFSFDFTSVRARLKRSVKSVFGKMPAPPHLMAVARKI